MRSQPYPVIFAVELYGVQKFSVAGMIANLRERGLRSRGGGIACSSSLVLKKKTERT